MRELQGLEVVDLWVSVGNKTILKGVNLKLPRGEFHALVGPNGAGKSTLAMTLAGYPGYKVVKGDILLDGESIKDLPPEERAKKGLAVLLQHPPELEGIRVAELLERLKGLYGCKDSVEDLLRRVGLPSDMAFRYVNVGFSGGERKRFDLARVIAMRPKIVVMDEPDSGVDVESIKRIADGIKWLLSQNAGVLVITHYRNILKYVKPHLVHVMIDGRIVKSGGPEILEVIEEKGFAGVVA
ncbi:Fe-S cluster assembly ATPase SufC [Ignicoccus hospitalis]|uniref:FeS assembly ATPase SufC n=1 Tax=Ignicoccus hospitalis (strain KIN4/I / DSM 18386 / JCM 14125) TaxID=453591 RepID=A8ABU3_IGNH4|nr:Fe-S cluster assembly ATPase SufC [Ignicoccus hospitalis]ABU82395.1 FeS assembly ATPase SufC [Ignicoccus hospitalis KIN4/I]HIH90870.1 Fe-S cluster assembly ATPase SufC [Desulfurococcaceae archaeon]